MFPVNVSLQKLTLGQALRYAVPLVPGTIIMAALAVRSSDSFHQFMQIAEIGYYSKLLVLLAAAYLMGLVLDEIVTFVIGSCFGMVLAMLLKSEARRKAIGNAAYVIAPWRDASWQKLASAYLGSALAPTAVDDVEWRSWYQTIKAGFPELEEGLRRSDLLLNAAHTAAWSLLIARLVLPGHSYIQVVVVVTVLCFFLSAINRVFLVLISHGYLASDLTGANLGAMMIRELRKENGAKQNLPRG